MAVNFDVAPNGMALNDYGLSAHNTIAGLGLLTYGFIWPCDAIWSPCCNPVTTTWIACDDFGNPTNVETCLHDV